MNDADAANLLDMLKAAKRVASYVAGKRYGDLESSGLLRDAVERQLEIVGEAARRVSLQSREAHPEISWTRIIAQRNVIAHEYEISSSNGSGWLRQNGSLSSSHS